MGWVLVAALQTQQSIGYLFSLWSPGVQFLMYRASAFCSRPHEIDVSLGFCNLKRIGTVGAVIVLAPRNSHTCWNLNPDVYGFIVGMLALIIAMPLGSLMTAYRYW